MSIPFILSETLGWNTVNLILLIFSLSLFRASQYCISVSPLLNIVLKLYADSSSEYSKVVNSVLSSAYNMNGNVWLGSGMSFIYIKSNNGPRIDPYNMHIIIYCGDFAKRTSFGNNLRLFWKFPGDFFFTRISYSNVSNSFDKSI